MTKNIFARSFVFIIAAFALFQASFVFAHQPYLVDGDRQTLVSEPEISKAYYGELFGSPATFSLHQDTPFKLYVGVLVPAGIGVPGDVSAEIWKGEEQIEVLHATSADWMRFYEPYAGDDYLQGPEYRSNVPPGEYIIKLFRPGNIGKYVLVVGEIESFTFNETIRTLGILPSLKSDFFGKPAWMAYLNRIGLFVALAFVSFFIIFFAVGELFRMIGNIFRRIFGKPKSIRD